MSATLFTNLASTVWPVAAVDTNKVNTRLWGLEVETALNALFSNPVIINGKLVATVNANVLTIALKTLANADPSATDPVYIVFRHATGSDGDQPVVEVQAATSLVVSAGSTLGMADGVAGRLRIVGFNDAGTFRLGVVNCWSANVHHLLRESGIASSTAEGGAGAADSAGVIYTGTAVTAKAFRLLGDVTWVTALATAGLWSAAPDIVRMFGPDYRAPNEKDQGKIWGLTLSNNGSDANNDVDIASGICSPEGDLDDLALTSSITKRSDAAWASGTGNGGMDTGSKTTNQWLYVWLIGKTTDHTLTDALFSASATAPTMPSGYDKKRRIGAVRTDGSSNIRAFKQDNDTFTFDVPINDASASNPGTAAVNRAITVPPGMTGIFEYWVNNVTTAAVQILVTEVAQTDTTPTTTLFHLRFTATSQAQSGEFRRKVNASSEVRVRHHASGASDALVLTTIGWVDNRGRLAA